MSDYKVNGLDLFAEHFKDFSNNYVIVGGTACYLAMHDIGLNFRATKDIDMIVTVEEISHEFGAKFWEFIRLGGYQVYRTKEGAPQFFRFMNPTNPNYPAMIELFSRKQDMFPDISESIFTPIVIDDEISSLSAILLNDEYYSFLKSGRTEINGIAILKPTHLIAFKAKAFVDLTRKKNGGAHVNSVDIKKHKNDVFRLVQLLTEGEVLNVSDSVKDDIRTFIELMKNEQIDTKALDVPITQEEAMNIISEVFEL